MMNARVVVSCAALAALAACFDDSGQGLPCQSDDNCPSALRCEAGRCADAVDRPGAPVPPDDDPLTPPGPPDDDEPPVTPPEEPEEPEEPGQPEEPEQPEEPQQPDALSVVDVDTVIVDTPRLVRGHGAGAAPWVYALEAGCGALARVVVGGTTMERVAEASSGCLEELDAVRVPGGDVVAVARRTWGTASSGGSAAAVMAFDDDDGLVSAVGFSPQRAGDHRGARPRITLGPGDVPRAVWFVRPGDDGDDFIERLVVGGAALRLVSINGFIDGLGAAFDDGGLGSLLVSERTHDRLLAVRNFDVDQVDSGVSGTVDAVACGAVVHVAYRKGAALLTAALSSSSVTVRGVDGGLGLGRARGDVALSCDGEVPWIAAVDQGTGRVLLYAPNVAAFTRIDLAAARGAVSLLVDSGRAVVATTAPSGRLRTIVRVP